MHSVLVALTFLSAAFLLSSCEKREKPPPPPPPGVVCVVAEKRDVANSYEYIGQIVAEDWVNLVARVEGYLIKRNFEEGSIVKKDDLVFEIDPRPFEAKVKEAEGQLTKAKATLENANIEFKRYSSLAKDNAVAQKTLDEATMPKGVAEGQVLTSEGELEIAQINLGYTRITAPFDGKIGVCSISVGNLVSPTMNTNLAKIVRLDPVKVEFCIPEAIVINIRQNAKSVQSAASTVIPRIVLPNGTAYPHEGVIYFADNEVNTATGTLMIRARFPNTTGLLTAGQYVKVRLETKEKIAAILIPQIAIQRDQTGEVVMTVDKANKVVRREVKTGQPHGTDIEVKEGLAEGDLVVAQGLLKIRSGMTVNVTMDSAKANGKPAKEANSPPTAPPPAQGQEKN